MHQKHLHEKQKVKKNILNNRNNLSNNECNNNKAVKSKHKQV